MSSYRACHGQLFGKTCSSLCSSSLPPRRNRDIVNEVAIVCLHLRPLITFPRHERNPASRIIQHHPRSLSRKLSCMHRSFRYNFRLLYNLDYIQPLIESIERNSNFWTRKKGRERRRALRIVIDQLATEQITIVATNKRSGNVGHSLLTLFTLDKPRLLDYSNTRRRPIDDRRRLNLTWKQETVLGFVSRPGRSQGTVLEQSGVATRESCYADRRETDELSRPRRGNGDDGDDDIVDDRGERCRPRNARERHD